MRRKEAQSATLPLGHNFSKVASLQIGPVVSIDGGADKITQNCEHGLTEFLATLTIKAIPYTSFWQVKSLEDSIKM